MKINLGKLTINVERSGNPAGPTVALSHSLGSSGIMWKTQLPTLEPRYDVVRIDTRGHGGSSAPQGKYAMNELVEDTVAVLDALGLNQVHWVGLSMGGMIGQGLGIHHPERLLSLSLCDTMAKVPTNVMPVWTERMKVCKEHGMQAMAAPAMERWFTQAYRSQPASSHYMEIEEQVRNTPLAGFLGCCHAIIDMDYLDQLAAIETPTLIMVGDKDMATPVSESKAMHQRIRGSTLEIIPDAAHFANVEQSDKFDGHLMSFLTGFS